MTEPVSPTPAPAPVKPSLAARGRALLAWVLSPAGRKDLGAVVAAVTAVYTALHRAGV